MPAIKIKIGDEHYKHLPPPPKGPCKHLGPDDTEGPKPLLARFVYTMLKNNFRAVGEFDDMRWAYFKEQTMERKRLFRLWLYGDRDCDALAIEHWKDEERDKLFESRFKAFFRWIYQVFRWTLAYGADFKRLLVISLSIVLFFSLVFMFSGFEYCTVNEGNKIIKRELIFSSAEIGATTRDFLTSLYMSIVTFTTLGYGDAHPLGATRIFAAIEACLGLIFMSLMVATLARGLWTGQ